MNIHKAAKLSNCSFYGQRNIPDLLGGSITSSKDSCEHETGHICYWYSPGYVSSRLTVTQTPYFMCPRKQAGWVCNPISRLSYFGHKHSHMHLSFAIGSSSRSTEEKIHVSIKLFQLDTISHNKPCEEPCVGRRQTGAILGRLSVISFDVL